MSKKKTDTMPYSLEAERSILACLIGFQDENIKEEIFLELSDEDFYVERNRYLFNLCKALWVKKRPVEFVTVLELVKPEEHNEYLKLLTLEILNTIPSNANYGTYINILKAKSNSRKIIQLADKLKEKALNDPYAARDMAMAELTNVGEPQRIDLEHIDTIAEKTLIYLTDIKTGNREINGIKTPYKKMNYFLGGFPNGEITVIAARPGIGKSAIVNEILLHTALKQKKKVALFNLEMSKEQIALRMYSNLLHVPLNELSKCDSVELCMAKERLKEAEIYVNTSAFTLEQICRAVRVQKKRKGLDMLCIDYLQLMGTREKQKDRRLEVEHITRQLKLLAMELQIPIVALSQLSRNAEVSDREPILSDLRESGSIEQDASQVIFLHREKEKEEAFGYREDIDRFLKVIIAKNRNGAIGICYMKFEADTMTFREVGKDGLPLEITLKPYTPAQAEMPF